MALLLLRAGTVPAFAVAAILGSYSIQKLLCLATPFGLSSSTRALRYSGLPKLFKPLHTKKSKQGNISPSIWLLAFLLSLVAAEIGTVLYRVAPAILLLVPCLAVYIGVERRSTLLQMIGVISAYLLLLLDGRPQVLSFGIFLTLLFSAAAFARKEWLLLGVTAISALFLSTLLPVTLGPTYALIGLAPLSLIIATRERLRDERELFRQLLVPVNVLAVVWALQADPRWLAAPIFINLVLTALAWNTKRRVSYAKYFLIFALAQLGIILFVSLPSTWLVLVLLIAAVGLVVLGASLGSLTTRLSGVVTLLISLFLFTALIMPFRSNTLLGREGLGILIAVGLPVFASWYANLVVKRDEQRLQYVILNGASVFAALIVFALLLLDTESSLRSFGLVVLGVVLLKLCGSLSIWRTASLTAIACGTLLLFTVDLPFHPEIGNLMVATSLIGLSGVALWLAARRTSRPAVY